MKKVAKAVKNIEVKLPDGSFFSLAKDATVADLAQALGPALFKAAVAGRVNGEDVDLATPLKDQDEVEIITLEAAKGLDILRHSTAHIMAEAVGELFPGTKFGIGPVIEDGFYYDFDLPNPLTPEDLPRIEAKMEEIIQQNQGFKRKLLPAEEAKEFFKKAGQDYKVELIEDLPDAVVSLYTQGSFIDLCRGPHIPTTKKVKAFKLLKIAGAYWRGNEHRPMLQRIYGTAFASKKDLQAYLEKVEEAQKRDHRLLGQQLDLFHLDDEVGPGLPLWHPKGALLRKTIEDFWREEHLKHGYEMVMIPHIARVELWKTSGHWEFYREYIYSPMSIEGQEYIVKPMNCPGHIKIYKTRPHSYKEFPLRWAELGTVYRYERSGVLHGLLRVRGFTQDDAHIFCRNDQLEEEIMGVINFVLSILKTFGFEEYEVFLSTRPQKFVGSLENWEKATKALESALEKASLSYAIDPGEGVFYGPKIDLKIKDALGRAWQCTTIQVDFNLPERFDMTYKGEDNRDHRPIMIHRALLGSLERFIGCLIEHYAGAFPLWLAPIQVVIIPIADRHQKYAHQVEANLKEARLRVEIDKRSESVSRKVRDAQIQKIPYVLVVGDREEENEKVAVRLRDGTDKGQMLLSELQEILEKEEESRSVKSLLASN